MDFQDRDHENSSDANLLQEQDQIGEAGIRNVVLPGGQDVVTLPPGASLEDLVVEGRDLVIQLEDGSRIVIPDGAVFVPQIVIDGVTVPPLNVAQLLTGNEPEPAAGAPGSSGGNFADDEGEIQAAYDLGDLLSFTDFGFPEDREEEVIPAVGEEPEVVIETPDNPTGVINATATVLEEGLPERNAEPEGTNEPGNGETTSGTIVFSAPDGLSAVTANGVQIVEVGQQISTEFGVLTITSIDLNNGEIGYSYTLGDNTSGDGTADAIGVSVIDADGDTATATLTINIIDDAPIAADDSGSVPAATFGPISGDVLANDTPGADDTPADAVTGFANSSGTAAAGEALQGEYGTLTLNSDGTYSYVRDLNTPGGVTDTFTYDIVDQDGSTSSATLVIDIADAPNEITFVPEVGEGTQVDEGGLPPRGTEPAGTGEIADADAGNDSDQSETTSSTITFTSPDGLESLTINGVAVTPGSLPQTIVDDATGTLVITGFTYDLVTGTGSVTYEFTLGDNTSGDDTSVEFDISVTDLDGDVASDTLTINITDDEPIADDDTGDQATEDAPVTVDVFANDTAGADDVQPGSIALVGGSLSGQGDVVYNGDGTFTYTPEPGEEGTVTFDYQITDGDGDVSTATVTITLQDDSEPEIAVEGDNDVDEAGLPARGIEPAGSDEASDSEIATGDIAIATGNDTVGSLVINGVDVTGGGTVTTTKGELTVTVTNGSYTYSYVLTDNTLTDPDSDAFSLTVTDSDGDTADTTLVIAIVDDSPAAADDANSIAAGEFGPATGDVLTNDTQGADGATVTSYSGTGGSGAAGAVVQGDHGTLTIAADGSYSYTRDAGTPGGVTDTFEYTITDGDGDTATANLVITIADSPVSLDLPVAGEAGTQVEEDGLAGPPAGSDAGSDSEFTTGTFTYSAPDGPAIVTIDGIVVTGAGQTFTGTYGTLTIVSVADGSITYTYELTTNTDGDDTFDDFVVRVTDQDGDFNEGALEIAIVDDIPTASADTDSVTEDGPLTASGNVITDAEANGDNGADVEGADGAEVTGVAAGSSTGPVSGDVSANVTGTYGSLVLNADGSYTYTLDNTNPLIQGLDSTESLTETFTYTITDGDGDTSTTTVTITINGADDGVTINDLSLEDPEHLVDEDDLPDGSSPDAAALTRSGTFSVDAQDGLATLTVGGVAIFGASVTYPVTITGDYGTLEITSVTPVLDANGDTVSLSVSYEYELTDNTLDHSASGEDSVLDSFDVVATDSDGSSDSSVLDIEVVDDIPTVENDFDEVTEDGPLTASGNVITDAEVNGDAGADVPGADGADVTGVVSGTSTNPVSGSVGSSVTGTYGSLVLNADGSYTYTLDNTNPLVQGLDQDDTLTETFTYTITDGDGDTATTTLTIQINGADDPIIISGLDVDPGELTVDEDDLADGSSPDAGALTQTGSFTITSQDGLAEIKAGGLTVWTDTGGFVAGQTISTAIGTFVITGVTPTETDANGDVTEATVTFSYELFDNTLTHSTDGEDTILESFGIEVVDTDGSTDTGSVDVVVIDDIPDVEASSTSAPQLVTDDTIVDSGGSDSDSTSFASLFTTVFGADGPAATDATVYSLSISGGDGTDSGLDDTLTGENILLRLNGDTIEGYLETSGDIAFTLALDPATGVITQTQNRAVEHDDPTDGMETAASGAAEMLAAGLISLTATVTDGDGDTDSESIDISGVFAFEDDAPTANDDTATQATENQAFTIDALANDAFGADDVDTSDAADVFVSTQATQGTVTYDPGTGLFTYTPNPGAGSTSTTDSFEYTIVDGDGDPSTATVTVTLQPDSEPQGNTVAATVDDDGLAGNNPASTMGDLDANVGDDPTDTSEASFTGTLSFNVGNDTPAVISFAAALDGSTASVGQETVTYSVSGNVVTATITGGARDGTALFTVEITDAATGAYVVTLLDNVLHSAGNDENDASASIDFVVTDSDGDTASASLDITFDDDAPTATDNSNSVTEGGMVGGNALTDDNGSGVDAAGADDYGLDGAIIRIDSVNEGTNDATADGSGNLVLAGEFGTLTINVDTGVYSYASNPNSTNVDAQDVFTYTIVDGDGDEATATLTIDIDNVAAQVSDNDVIVNEAGLPIGSDPTSDSEIDADGQITVTGASGTLTYTLLSPADGTYGTIVLNPVTGEYTYTLDTPFTDTVDENGANVVNGAESFNYEVRDDLGNLIGTGTIDVSIIDDIPTATDQLNIPVAEDAVGTIGGNVTTDGTPDTEGADGATVTAITIDGATTAVPQDGTDATVTTANGTYTIDMDGNWTFDPNPNLDHSSGDIDASFTYTLTDGDGDFDTAVQPITITDGADPAAGPDISLALDDQNLADGSTPAADDFDSDTIVFTEGSDDIASIVFGDTSGLDGGLTWVRVSDTQITGSDGGRLVVTLDLSVTGTTATVTATLNDNYDDHPTVDVDDLVDLGDVDVIATDIDGDTASATVEVTVSDDLPTVSAGAPGADALTVDETDFATDATADFSGLFTPDFNADNPGTIGDYTLGINAGSTGLVDTETGEAVVLSVNGGVVEGRTATTDQLVFTVSVDSSGTVTLDQQRAVEHADDTDHNDDATLAAANLITLSATVTDSDGDTATATANIAGAMTFLDDGPALANVVLGGSVDVDETDGFPTSDTSAASILSFTSDFGADGDNGTAFAITVADAASGLATADGDFPITLVQTSATVITGTFNDGSGDQTAFTVTINADGTITLEQNVALEHLIDGDDSAGEHNDTLDLTGKINATVTITDGDDDTASATVAIGSALTFFDDGPSVTLSGSNPDLQVSDADLATDASLSFAGAFTFDGGEDGTASTAYAVSVTDGSASGIYDTATGNQVFLFLEAGVVVGREGTDAADAASGAIVFTVTVDGSGNVELDQLRAVDHSLSNLDGANATLVADTLVQLTATITDNDGDTDTATLDIGSDLLFADDTPTAEPTLTAFLDDDTQGGNAGGPDDQDPDESNLTGTLVDPTEGFGNDGGTVAFDLGSTLPAGFRLVADPSSDGVIIEQEQGTGNWVAVVTVSLDESTGSYTVSQNANILHEDDVANEENEVSFTLDATLTDGDGDTAPTSLTITVDDDTPVANAASSTGTVDEDGLPGGITDNGSNDVPGADLTANGFVTGLFTVGADDPLTYSLDDSSTAALDALGLTSNGVAVTYTISGNTITAVAGTTPIFTFTLDPATGAWAFTLQGPLDHATGDSENATDIVVEFASLIRATDVDGDEVAANAGASIAVTIDDDSPRAHDDTNALAEDTSSVGGNVLTDGTADQFGADGAGDPAITGITGSGGAGTVGGTTTGTWGTLDLAADGSYTYNLNTAAVQGLDDGETETDTFTYTIVDADGDTSEATLTITINGANDAPVANADTNWTIEDAASAITGDVLDNVDHSGAPDGQPRADVADTDVDIEPLTVSTTGTFNGTYGVLTLNSDGTYSYRLYMEAENQAAYDTVQALDEGDAPLTDTFNYTATDGDASANSTLTISIFGTNDAPVVGTATVATSDEGLAGGLPDATGNPTDTTNLATANGNISISDVDDSSFTVTLSLPTESLAVADGTATGAAITWSLSPDGKTLTGTINGGATTAIAVVIDDTGAFTVTQSLPIFHSDTMSEDVTSFTVDVNVNDGTDTTTQTDAITVNLEDDSPQITGMIANEQILNNPGDAPLVGDLNFVPGGDGADSDVTITVNTSDMTVSGAAVSTSQSGNVLTGYVDNDNSGTFNAGDTAVFTLTVDPNAGTSGEYEFDLLVPVDGEITIVDIGTDGAFGTGPTQSVTVSQGSTGDELAFVTGWEPNGNGGLFTSGELTAWLGGGNPDLSQRSDINGSTLGFGLGNNDFDAGEFMRFDFGPLNDYDGTGSYTPPGGTDLLNATFVTFSLENYGGGDVVHFVAHYTDGTTESFTLTGSGANSTETLTITAPPGKFIGFVDAYVESGSVKLDLDEVGATETLIDVDIPVSIELTDADGDPVSDDFVIKIFDETPDAQDDLEATVVVDEGINAAFVLDFSGSINNSELNLQLNAVKDAAYELFENTTGTVNLTLITFSSTAQTEGTFSDFASFAAAIDGLNNQLGGSRPFNGGTDFTAAIEEVLTEFTPDSNASNQVFFLSDGNPNEQTGSGGNSLSDPVAAQWQTFINDNDINVTAIGVGGGINNARLQDVDLDGEGTPILATDFEDLVDTLISVVTPPISDNVLANDTGGTGAISVVSITVDGVTYAFDGVNTITPTVGSPITGTSFTVTTAFGGELTFDFSDGSYTYDPPTIVVTEVENFQYTVVDADGDTDIAILRIDIAAAAQGTNFARNDVVITNTSAPVAIDEAWLLANDNAGTVIGSVGNATSGSVSRGGGTTTFVDTGASSGSFTYTATNGGNDNNAFVTVNVEQEGQSQLDGTSGADILIGRDGADDDIIGNEGADIMFGGTGSDDFIINDGDATVTIGGSGDNGTITGYDTIVDFDVFVDDIDFTDFGARGAASDTSGTNGTDSTLTVNGSTIKSHSITDGIITFDDQDSFSSALTLTTEGDLAAAVQYIQAQGSLTDIGENNVVAFIVGGDTYIYNQDRSTINVNEDSLIKLEGVVITDLSSLLGSVITPVVLDLDGDGTEFVGLDAGVAYDYDGDGTAEATAWVGADDAILAFDANGDGTVSDASEFVFGGDGLTDLEAVAARFDDNGDGVLDASDAAYAQFGIWQDANLDGIADDGEFTTLEDAGIVSIDLVSDEVDSEAAGGDVGIFGKSTFTWANGQVGEVADTAFVTERQNNRSQEQAMAAAAGFGGITIAEYSEELVTFDEVELESISTFDVAAIDDLMPVVTINSDPDLSGLLPATTVTMTETAAVNLLSGSDGLLVAPGLSMFDARQVREFEMDGADELAVATHTPAVLSSGLDGGGVAQAMEALLLLETVPVESVDGNRVVPGEAASITLTEIANDSLLDQIIDHFDAPARPSEYLIANDGPSDGSILDHLVEASINTLDPLHLAIDQTDEAAMTVAQA